MGEAFSNIKTSLKLTGGVLFLSVITFIISVILILIFGVEAGSLISYNPFTNGFMHSSLPHISENMLNLLILFLADINTIYTLRKFYWSAVILSSIYLPFVLLGLAQPVVGISGMVYFLASRFIITNKNRKALRWIGYILYGFAILGEISQLGKDDGVAHLFHLLGAALGAITVLPVNKYIPNKLNKIIN
jgi:membrane associated rhomboid family serine protease